MDDEAGVEVWRGGVNTWECDRMGHLNVRFYVAHSLEGLAGLAARLGLPHAFAPHAGATLVVREQHIRFLREARPGDHLTLYAGVVEMGETDARLLLVMRHEGGLPAAAFQMRVEHVTADEGRPFPWPSQARRRAEDIQVQVPVFAAARGVAAVAAEASAASAERAEALGLRRLRLGLIQPQDCDAFGRMRLDGFMGRISDGVSQLLGPSRTGPAGEPLGDAALEYHLVHLGWPRVGDRVEVRSAFTRHDDRFRWIVHWLLDAETGRPLAAAESMIGVLDLQARKLARLTPDMKAAIEAATAEGLTL